MKRTNELAAADISGREGGRRGGGGMKREEETRQEMMLSDCRKTFSEIDAPLLSNPSSDVKSERLRERSSQLCQSESGVAAAVVSAQMGMLIRVFARNDRSGYLSA